METVSIIDSIEDFEMMEVVAFLRNFKINNKNAGLVRLATKIVSEKLWHKKIPHFEQPASIFEP